MAVDVLARAEEAQAAFEDHKASMGDNATEEAWATFDELAEASAQEWDRVHAERRASGRAPVMVDQANAGADVLAQFAAANGGAVQSGGGMSFFDALAESPAMAAFSAGDSKTMQLGAEGATIDDLVKAGFDWQGGAKADLTWTGDTDKSGQWQNPERLPGITDMAPVVGPRIRSFFTNMTTTQRAVEWIKIVSKQYGSQITPEAQSSDPIDDGATPPAGTTTSVLGGVKPYNDFTMSIESTTVKTLPVLHDITEDTAEDLPQLVDYIRQFMFEDIRVAEDDNLMNGNGGVNALDGLLGTKWALPTYDPTGDTDIDAIIKAMAEIMNQGSFPNGIVMNPTDFYSDGFLLAKNANGDYQMGNPRASAEQLNSLWGMPVATSPVVAQGTVLVGDFRQAIVWDRHTPRFQMTNSHNDNFGRNIITMRLEERLAFGVRKPEAFRVITPV